jgi:hypothetical protein
MTTTLEAAPERGSTRLDRLRARMERAIERLLAALDALDAETEDFEENGDLEPSLGSNQTIPVFFNQNGTVFHQEIIDQEDWARGGDRGEREEEHDGREPGETPSRTLITSPRLAATTGSPIRNTAGAIGMNGAPAMTSNLIPPNSTRP